MEFLLKYEDEILKCLLSFKKTGKKKKGIFHWIWKYNMMLDCFEDVHILSDDFMSIVLYLENVSETPSLSKKFIRGDTSSSDVASQM